jgi:hypothetical protein
MHGLPAGKRPEAFEMHINPPRLQLRKRGAKTSIDDLSLSLLLGVWGLTFGHDVHHPAAYIDHCRNLLDLLAGHSSSQIDRKDIIDLVELVGASRDKSIEQIKGDIRAANAKWMISAVDNDSLLAALEFVIRLWLFIKPQLADGTRTLPQVVALELPQHRTSQHSPGHLTRDFCATSLTRRGGIKIEWTSYLSDHLTFVGKARLRVFRHVAVLRKYSQSKERSVHEAARSCHYG